MVESHRTWLLFYIQSRMWCTRSGDKVETRTRPQAHENKSGWREEKKVGKKQLLSTKRPVISMVPLVRYFRYPRSLGSIFVMPSIGSNFFGKARGVCGNLLEKQFLLFLYTLFLLSECLLLFLFKRFNWIYNRILEHRHLLGF